jgi:hypothetical protein
MQAGIKTIPVIPKAIRFPVRGISRCPIIAKNIQNAAMIPSPIAVPSTALKCVWSALE